MAKNFKIKALQIATFIINQDKDKKSMMPNDFLE